jgi:hypothetical protein
MHFPRPLRIRRRLLFDAVEVRMYLEQLKTADTESAD